MKKILCQMVDPFHRRHVQRPTLCVSFSNVESHDEPALSCTGHEEADTRLFAHLNYCKSNNIKQAVIYCSESGLSGESESCIIWVHTAKLRRGVHWWYAGAAKWADRCTRMNHPDRSTRQGEAAAVDRLCTR